VQHPVKRFQGFVFIAPFPLPMTLFLLPDTLQRLAELPAALWSCQVTLPKDPADPPHLKTAKDQGDQSQLDVSRVQIFNQLILPGLSNLTLVVNSTGRKSAYSGGKTIRRFPLPRLSSMPTARIQDLRSPDHLFGSS
jgi:hypothetical protein